MVKKLTLDTNCLIALENNEAAASNVAALVQRSKSGSIRLAILGISASENQRSLFPVQSISEFQVRLTKIGLSGLEILQPIAFWDITFWDWSIIPSSEDIDLLNNIWAAIFPQMENDWQKLATAKGIDVNDQTSKEQKRWRNALCDVQIAWATINYGYDALVTLNTSDFQRNLPALKKLGLNLVWTPEEALLNV